MIEINTESELALIVACLSVCVPIINGVVQIIYNAWVRRSDYKRDQFIKWDNAINDTLINYISSLGAITQSKFSKEDCKEYESLYSKSLLFVSKETQALMIEMNLYIESYLRASDQNKAFYNLIMYSDENLIILINAIQREIQTRRNKL